MKIHVRELMRRLSDLMEMLVGLLMLAALAAALIGLVQSISPVKLIRDPAAFSEYLSVAAMLVIGVEFVKMLCSHTLDSVIEIMLLAIARQMIVEHTSPAEMLQDIRCFCNRKEQDSIDQCIQMFQMIHLYTSMQGADNNPDVMKSFLSPEQQSMFETCQSIFQNS